MSHEVTSRRAVDPRGELAGSLASVAMAVLFAAVVIFGKQVEAGNLPFVMLAMRFGGQSVLLVGALLLFRRPLLPEKGERLALVLAGTIGYGSEAAFYFSALNHGNTAAITLLFYTYPVWVMLTTIAIDRRVPRGKLVVALLLAIGGSAVVVAGSSGVELRTLGIVLALCCSLAYSAYLISTDRIVKRTNPMTSAMWLSAGAAIGNLTYSFLFNSHVVPSGGDWWRVVGMAVFSAGAFACMLAGLQRIGAVRNAIIGVMEPLTVAVLAAIFLSEPITVATALGGTLILGGAVLATLVRTTRNPEPNL